MSSTKKAITAVSAVSFCLLPAACGGGGGDNSAATDRTTNNGSIGYNADSGGTPTSPNSGSSGSGNTGGTTCPPSGGINYQPIGSSGGLKQIKARATDFGGSDVALSLEESQKEKLICFPSAISGVVPVLNLPGMKSGDVQLTGEVLAGIFGRKILFWNDPAIAAVNPGIRLPKTAIVVIVREDGSGTTYNFTDYLSNVSPSWKHDTGTNFKVEWPEGNMQVKGSSANFVRLPDRVRARIYSELTKITDREGKPLRWNLM